MNRQKADNKARFGAMVAQVRAAAEDWVMFKGSAPIPYHVIAHAIREADGRTIDDRTACRWVVLMLVPPGSLWKGGAVLQAMGPVQYGASGKVKARSVMRNSYKVLLAAEPQNKLGQVILCK